MGTFALSEIRVHSRDQSAPPSKFKFGYKAKGGDRANLEAVFLDVAMGGMTPKRKSKRKFKLPFVI